MAKCDQGYLCEVCGKDVPEIEGSDLYLRYVIGELHGGSLMASPERHLRCNPTLAQYIVDPGFQPPVFVDGPFDKRQLDPQEVGRMEVRVTRGWQRLQEVRHLGIPIADYPLAKAIAES